MVTLRTEVPIRMELRRGGSNCFSNRVRGWGAASIREPEKASQRSPWGPGLGNQIEKAKLKLKHSQHGSRLQSQHC